PQVGRCWVWKTAPASRPECAPPAGGPDGLGRDVMAIRILLADDHRLILEGLRLAFEEVDGIEVVGMANEGRQVLPLIATTNPDVVLLDMRLPDMDGLTCLERIRKLHPTVKVVMLSASSEPARVRAALTRGASAYI